MIFICFNNRKFRIYFNFLNVNIFNLLQDNSAVKTEVFTFRILFTALGTEFSLRNDFIACVIITIIISQIRKELMFHFRSAYPHLHA